MVIALTKKGRHEWEEKERKTCLLGVSSPAAFYDSDYLMKVELFSNSLNLGNFIHSVMV